MNLKMKNIWIIAFTFILIVTGCDVLEEPYKKDGVALNTDRKILLEDYTGHRCPNCPQAGKEIKNLSEAFGNNIVFIAVHSGTLAKLFVPPTTYNFTTETGDIWCDFFEVEKSGFPNGLINRKERSGSKIVAPASWAAVAAEQLNMPIEAEISLEATFDAVSRLITINTATNILKPVAGEQYYLTVVLTEDSIIQPQMNLDPNLGSTPFIHDYAHNHVLRFSFNGPWGTSINSAIVEKKTFTKVLDANSDIIPKNCRIVAFIHRANKEVLQAEEAKLTP